jgi:CDP-diacylglycerol--serine O-phosphatidyltransferase
MKLRQLMFVLPNLFTVSSIFCGFYALTLCAGEAAPGNLYQAALAIFFGIFFDGFDGRVARLTKTQSQFGMELDSLADVITFGVAPGMLMWRWALQPLGFWGIFISFMFCACGALRLARFNVIAQNSKHGGSGSFFVGLPIPLAAGVVISMVIAYHGAKGPVALPEMARVPVAIVAVFLALLMVSTVRYRTFKDLRLSRKSALVFMFVIAAGVVIATQLHPAWVLVAYFSAYLVFGLGESAVLLGRYVKQRRSPATAAADVLDEDEDEDDANDVDDNEVL